MIGFTFAPAWRGVTESHTLLNELWIRGCRSIELYLHPFDSEADATLSLARSVLERGFSLTIHAPTDGDFNAVRYTADRDAVESAHHALLAVVDTLSTSFEQPILINFHGGQGVGPRSQLLEGTRQFAHWLAHTLADEYTSLRAALEILPYDPAYLRVGDRQEDLLHVSEGLDLSRFGLCWDMGHLQRNRAMFDYGGPPVDAFVQRVVHAHVHEVDTSFRDHCPLGRGAVSIASDVERLITAGYAGVYNLELSFENAAEHGDPLDELFRSVISLQEIIETSRKDSGVI